MSKEETTVVYEVDAKAKDEMASFYAPFSSPSPSPYVVLFAKGEEVSVCIYAEKKGLSKIVFQGKRAKEESDMWRTMAPNAKVISKKEANKAKEEPRLFNLYPQIGSDEVGTGDFFGPIIVAASYVRKEDLPYLEEMGITDSKKMNDDYILSIGPALIKRFDYSELALDNEKYNEVRKDFNMNAIKAKMHNRVLLNLLKKHPEAHMYMDQFAEPGLYFSYLKNENEVAKKICFSTKGESQFPSVALGSVIARYAFLRKMDAMGKRFGVVFPKGAGVEVDSFAKDFLASHDEETLERVAKKNFANWKKLF